MYGQRIRTRSKRRLPSKLIAKSRTRSGSLISVFSQNSLSSISEPEDSRDLKRQIDDGKLALSDLEKEDFEWGVRWREVLKPSEFKKRFVPGFYWKLVTEEVLSLHARSIIKDIHRTFPHHRLFNPPCDGKKKLLNILKAYSIFDIDVGYSQGLAFLGGFLLLHIDDEEEAFWCLVRLMTAEQYNLRAMYKASECYVLKLLLRHMEVLLASFRPKIAAHFEHEGIEPSMFATQWFCTLFAYRFNQNFSAEVWDRFLRHGPVIIFQIALSLLDHLSEKILELPFERLVPFLSHPPVIPIEVAQRATNIAISREMVNFLFNVETNSSNR